MALIVDLENPIDPKTSPFGEALLSSPRPEPPQQEYPRRGPSKPRPYYTFDDYFDHASSSVSTRFGKDNLSSEEVTEIIEGRAWVVPNLLTLSECEDIIQEGENYGMDPPLKGPSNNLQKLRTSSRTGNFFAPELSSLVNPRLPSTVLEAMERTRPGTAFMGIHPNWRLGKYEPGQFFSAHYDQSDSLTIRDEESKRGKRRLNSFQTLLISLSDRGELEGGQTRLYPEGRYDDTAMDIELPRGWGLVFDHRLLHAGLPPCEGLKYIAQAGLLRDEPKGVMGAVSTFKYGPGLIIE